MPSTVASSQSAVVDLDSHYPLTTEQIASYRARGFIKLKEVLSPATLAHYERAISSEVNRWNRQSKPMSERTTYEKAFLQITNIWENDPQSKQFVFSKRLGRIAAELMGVGGVRLYHDQALYKEAGGGITPWHCDQSYWPLADANSTTVWVPFQAVPLEMGPLAFAIGSHNVEIGRGVGISDESERMMAKALAALPTDEGPFDLGEVSFHAGWTFHRAGGNSTDVMRRVMTVIYIADDMRVAEPKYDSQRSDLEAWFPGLKPGDLAASRLNPVIWRK
jgi:ectoine hydroxylase-related dioxygenase (phytanoyl-CoA dioxygenase family)